MAGTIGIKIANGDFYPILEENSLLKKRLVLTTVHDEQENVQIDLYRSLSKSMLDGQYIGSLVVESLMPRPKGEPSIEMIISCDDEGNITADAYDLDAANSEHHTLNVSLKTMDIVGQEDSFADFDLGGKPSQASSGLYSGTENEKEEGRKFPWLIMGLATAVVVIVIGLLWFFFLGGRDTLSVRFARHLPPPPISQPAEPEPEAPPQVQRPVTPPPPVQPPAPPPPPVATPAPKAPPVIQAPTAPPPARPQAVQRTRPPAPVMSYKVPAVIPKNGVVYQIRWGDTLWDISAAFYRNPWLYPRIARHNNIRNPDHILAGSNVRIPPLN